ncbi:testisin [Salarias fasciatus]|uniref:Testisin-like n=1 Tax=Salarias fasciatus TaxID=181472 RepID=A0A672JQ54_SALFA|nr:testisin-like [Salarias fasciatus]
MVPWTVCVLLLSAGLARTGSNAQECGQAPLSSRVVGGGDAPAGSWPWQVSMHVRGSHICAGTVIGEGWVLTAAHCIITRSVSEYTLYFGRNTQAGPNPNEVRRAVSQIIVHPNYNNTFLNNDVALMKLDTPVTYTNFIRPACLASNASHFNNATSCWATGWGRTAKDVSLPASSPLQEVQIPVIGNNQCACTYVPAEEANITAQMICAGQRNKGICQGDSGGPLQCKQNSTWIQAGIASFGIPCATGFPEVYARVSEFQAWITEQVAGASVGFVTYMSSGADPDATVVCRSTNAGSSTKFATELAFLVVLVKVLLQHILDT